MTFEKQDPQTPTEIGRMQITLVRNPHWDFEQEITTDPVIGEWSALTNPPNPGSVSVTDLEQSQTFIEGTDYEINYPVGGLRMIAGSAMTAGETYRIVYQIIHKTGSYKLEILDQNGDLMDRRAGALIPHLTAAQKTVISDFLDGLYDDATAQIL